MIQIHRNGFRNCSLCRKLADITEFLINLVRYVNIEQTIILNRLLRRYMADSRNRLRTVTFAANLDKNT